MALSKMPLATLPQKQSTLKILIRVLIRHSAVSATLTSLLTCLVAALAWQRRRFATNVKYHVGVPILGSLPAVLDGLFKFRVHDDFAAWHKALGRTFAMNFGGVCCVSTIDPKNLQYILKQNFDNYVKGSIFTDPFSQLLGDGIFNVDGEKWYHQRKTASRMFTKKVFETHIWQVVGSNIQKVTELFNRSEGQSLDMFSVMNRFTLDTIGEIGFSRSMGSIEDPSSPFLKSFDYVQSALAKRAFTSQSFPSFKLLRLFGLFWERELPAHLQLLNDYSADIVDDLMRKVSEADDISFVGLFAKDEEGQAFWRRDEAGFRTYMRDMVLNFLIAGRDTTAQCLTWTFFELAQCPDAVAKIRDEVRRVCGDGHIEYQDYSKLQYTRAAVDEGLRLHPSVPLDAKLTLNDDVLPDGTVVPAGTRMFYMPYAQGRDVEFWGTDADLFRPERWAEFKHRPSTYDFVAFNAGQRECLGKRLAEMEMVTMIANTVRDFDFELTCDPKDVKYDIQLTLGCSTGMPIKMTQLKRSV